MSAAGGLPRHGASLPIGLGVSCSADRQALGKSRDGVFLEELEHNPEKYLPEIDASALGGPVFDIDLRQRIGRDFFKEFNLG